jgi:hypothetical protein
MITFLRRAALALTALAPGALLAQSEAYAPLILRLPASTRALSMGNVGIASRDDDVLFYNPAQLVAARGTSLSVEQFSPSARAGALSSVSRLNTGGIAVGATIAEFESPGFVYPVSRGDMLGRGSNIGTSASLVLGIAQAAKGTRIGGSVKYVEERIANTRNNRGLLDLGLARDFFGYAVGLSVQNIGKSFAPTPLVHPSLGPADEPLPGSIYAPSTMPLRTTLGAGRAIPAGPLDVFATGAVSVLRDGFVTPAGGAEIGYSWLDGYSIILRGGARRPERGEGPMTAGAGFIMDRLSIDYALETLSGSRVGHRIGLRVR